MTRYDLDETISVGFVVAWHTFVVCCALRLLGLA